MAQPVNAVSAKQLNRLLKPEAANRAFLGFIRRVEESEEKAMEAPGESKTTQKPKWDPALPEPICAVLEEYDDLFPQDLPLGLPPVRKGMNLKLKY